MTAEDWLERYVKAMHAYDQAATALFDYMAGVMLDEHRTREFEKLSRKVLQCHAKVGALLTLADVSVKAKREGGGK